MGKRWNARRARVAAGCCALGVAVSAPAACVFAACNDIECPSYVRADFTTDLGGGIHDVAARVCFDETCNTADGVLFKQGPPVDQPPLEVDLVPGQVLVTLDLDGVEFDKATPHLIVAQLKIDGQEPVVLERNVELIGEELQGQGCGYCWHTRLSSERDRVQDP